MVAQVRAWHPEVPSLREVYHARFDHAYPMHTHDVWTVMILDEGAVTYDLDHADHHVTPAAVTALPPDIPHDGRSAIAGKSYRKRVLYLEPDWLPESLRGRTARTPTLAGPELLRAVRGVHTALHEPADVMAAEHWLIEARRQILARFGTPASTRRDVPLAHRLRDLLNDHLIEPITIAEAAEQLGAHPSHLTRVFSQTYGIPPHQYLVGRRVDRARHLLVDGHRPAEAAVLAGFFDQAHLTRHFRRVLGTTPATFAAQPPTPTSSESAWVATGERNGESRGSRQ